MKSHTNKNSCCTHWVMFVYSGYQIIPPPQGYVKIKVNSVSGIVGLTVVRGIDGLGKCELRWMNAIVEFDSYYFLILMYVTVIYYILYKLTNYLFTAIY